MIAVTGSRNLICNLIWY